MDMKNKNASIFLSISNFFRSEVSGGVVVLISALVGIILANSPLKDIYFSILETKVGLSFGELKFSKTVLHWINDALMVIFFLVVGLEIKREMLVGELASVKKSVFPSIAALGGVLAPITIYSIFNFGKDSFRGWGIPMATDIAFTIAVMMLMGKLVSHASKVNITALAIVDDIMALLVIAIFYSTGVRIEYVLISFLVVAVILILNKLNIRFTIVYVILGFVLWILFLHSGIHPTIAGVLLAFAIPSNVTQRNLPLEVKSISDALEKISENISKGKVLGTTKPDFQETKLKLKRIEPPLQRFETSLTPWVSFLILPLFALANSGVYVGSFTWNDLTHPVLLGVAVGLLLGKSTGIFTLSYLATRIGIAEISEKLSWKEFYGVSWFAGIGFTMALFIAHLSFDSMPHYLDLAKVGIYIGSLGSVIVGVTLLLLFNIRSKKKPT
ncbi:MAG: Na+/H+ antiporter NhaA [Spirochaetia bacterium]|nr:Na+/H+ antiporter NhaA [Spirochaetota bacterium]MDW8113215.1 Na+/H+ antiporter NhaA [Spirochaetia bacterium]